MSATPEITSAEYLLGELVTEFRALRLGLLGSPSCPADLGRLESLLQALRSGEERKAETLGFVEELLSGGISLLAEVVGGDNAAGAALEHASRALRYLQRAIDQTNNRAEALGAEREG